jgi:hypothetical protein
MARPRRKSGTKSPDAAGPEARRAGVLVSVDDVHIDRVDEVADELRAAGLDVDQVMGASGMITGSMEPSKVDALKKIRGVSAVELERHVRIPPPDSEVQ